MALCRVLDRYDPVQGTRCFSCGFSRNCERSEVILGVRPTPPHSPRLKGDTPGGLYPNQLGVSPIRPSLPAPSAVRMLMNCFGRDPHGNRNAHFDNYKAQRSLQDTLRNWPLPSGLEERRCIRDGSHASAPRAEIPTWPNWSLTRRLPSLIAGL